MLINLFASLLYILSLIILFDAYIDDLNYEWIGGSTHVVICGDFIDPVRTSVCTKNGNIECSYYPQIELKIFMFINSINRQIQTGGKIIKLLGNHELGNILSPGTLNQYIIVSSI